MSDDPQSRRRLGLGRAVERTLGAAAGSLGSAARRLHVPRLHRTRPGAPPGYDPEQHPGGPGQTGPGSSAGQRAEVTVHDIAPDRTEQHEVDDPAAFFDAKRPDWVATRWINVCGLGDAELIQRLSADFHLHPLAVEDVLHVPQRPKLETFEAGDNTPADAAQMFVITKMITFDAKQRQIDIEQMSIFLSQNTVITFQERPGDVLDPVRERLRTAASHLRRNDASFLFYALIDAAVDHYYPVLESLAQELEKIDDLIYISTDRRLLQRIHDLKRQLLLMRREVWPMRNMCSELVRDNHPALADHTRTYLRDVLDHVVQVLDLLETYRDLANGLADAYMNTLSTRMNEVMKLLTVIAALFIPVTFLAGVYGMNFDRLPGQHSPWAFPIFCGACVVICAAMLAWFKKKDWL